MFYSLVLFFHVGAALGLASALSVDALILFQLQRATRPSGTHPWLELWPAVPRIAGGSGLLLLFSGGYLTSRMSGWILAWPTVALAALILTGVLGGITGKRMRALGQVGATDKPGEFTFLRQLDSPILKVSLSVRIALVLAAVLLMTAKPELLESLGIVAGSIVLGSVAAFFIPRSGSERLTADPDARS